MPNKPVLGGILPILFLLAFVSCSHPINRKELVMRHAVVNTAYDSLSSLSVGNGNFAFTVDITGLQSFPRAYANGVALGTQSTWGWHSFPDTAGYLFSETLEEYPQCGRLVSYAVQGGDTERSRNATRWYRQNPHRLQLGNIGFEFLLGDGTPAAVSDIRHIRQSLDMYSGEIVSCYTVENIPVRVFTVCHPDQDAVSVRIHSPMLRTKRMGIRIVFPYPTDAFKDTGTDYSHPDRHMSAFRQSSPRSVLFEHRLDTTRYILLARSSEPVTVTNPAPHEFRIRPDGDKHDLEITWMFCPGDAVCGDLPTFDQTQSSSRRQWKQFWESGGAVDFSGSTDPRAHELERRIILSEYLTNLQWGNGYPPQETGLTYNSWYGKPHLEMTWWHAYHYALWGRAGKLEELMDWYGSVIGRARKLAERQGYAGVRWQKMTDNEGRETASSVGSFLIWQQPHVITFAELCYRASPTRETLERYKDLVFATADFMADFACYDSVRGKYVLGKGVIPAQERFPAGETVNPTYELAYWYRGLAVAQQWRERLGMPPDDSWNEVLLNLSPLPVQDHKYLFTESATDSYSRPEYRTDHPAVLGTLGMLPGSERLDTTVMQNTFEWIRENWNWEKTWGWDFPLTAMTATRLHRPEEAVEALLMPVTTNTYLPNGHNYQDERLTIYLPGNGGLLTAVAMMCAGYDGCGIPDPGIPHDGRWKVRWEGLVKMP